MNQLNNLSFCDAEGLFTLIVFMIAFIISFIHLKKLPAAIQEVKALNR